MPRAGTQEPHARKLPGVSTFGPPCRLVSSNRHNCIPITDGRFVFARANWVCSVGWTSSDRRTIVPGAQGGARRARETTAEPNLRSIAQLAEISQAQTRGCPEPLIRAVSGGSAAIRFSGSSPNTSLPGRCWHCPLRRRRPTEGDWPVASTHQPAVVFGSFARREADADSDIDVVIVRPTGTDEDDETWFDSIETWRHDVRRLTGNQVEVLEVGADEVASKLDGRSQLWRDIRREGLVVHGPSIDDLRAVPVG